MYVSLFRITDYKSVGKELCIFYVTFSYCTKDNLVVLVWPSMFRTTRYVQGENKQHFADISLQKTIWVGLDWCNSSCLLPMLGAVNLWA